MSYFGLDFGTSNSVLARLVGGAPEVVPICEKDPDGVKKLQWVVPSVVTFDADGRRVFCGDAAREMAYMMQGTPVRSVKRAIAGGKPQAVGERQYRPQTIASLLFRYFLGGIAEEESARPVPVVITVPANSKGLQREATKQAASAAGFRVLTLINEPTAAAMAYGVDLEVEQNILVYDFGGGTFDVTVLRSHHGLLEELSSRGVGELGGDDFDCILAKSLLQRHKVEVPQGSQAWGKLLWEAEKWKIRLSSDEEVPYSLAWGEYLPGAKPLAGKVTREEFNKLAAPLIEKTRAPVQEAIAAAQTPDGKPLTLRDIDVLLLVGGTSRMPAVRESIEGLMNLKGSPGIDPMTCVAQGAAIASGVLQRAPELNVHYLVRMEHSLCTDVLDRTTGKMRCDPIIERGHLIPARQTKAYSPTHDYQTQVQVLIVEGDEYHDPENPANFKIGEIHLQLDPPRPKDQVKINVTFMYMEDGTIQATAKDATTGHKVDTKIDYVTDPKIDDVSHLLVEGSSPAGEAGAAAKATGESRAAAEPKARPEPGIGAEAGPAASADVMAQSLDRGRARLLAAVSDKAERTLLLARQALEKLPAGNDKDLLASRVLRLEDALCKGNPNEVESLTNGLLDEIVYYG